MGDQTALARARAREIVAEIRKRGFRDGGQSFTDRQVWQAALDCRSTNYHKIAVHLVDQVIQGKTPPESFYSLADTEIVAGRKYRNKLNGQIVTAIEPVIGNAWKIDDPTGVVTSLFTVNLEPIDAK
jgi:hypothetical protein